MQLRPREGYRGDEQGTFVEETGALCDKGRIESSICSLVSRDGRPRSRRPQMFHMPCERQAEDFDVHRVQEGPILLERMSKEALESSQIAVQAVITSPM